MPITNYQALVLALTLAWTVEKDELADQYAEQAEQIASSGKLTDKQVADAQVEAAAAAILWNSEGE
jgi:hypothetical protein